MPAYRKPTELLELSGAFAKNPQRRRPVGPKSDRGIGDPPPHLVPDEAAAWVEFVGNMPANVLTSADRWALELVARLVAKSRREGLTGAELGHLRALLNECGATPASRSRVLPAGAAEAPPAGNPWDVAPVQAAG
jgi:hypothetical protein